MKQLSSAMRTHLAGEVTNLRTCWRATLADGTRYGFTDHVDDLTFDGFIYRAATGYTPSAIASNSALSVDNLDVQGVLDGDVLTEDDLQCGRWDYADVDVFQVNCLNLEAGKILQHRGKLGEVRTGRTAFVAELRGLSQQMQQTVGELYTPTCRARLGDARCGVNLAPLTVTGAISTVTDQRSFTDVTRTEGNGYFDGGLLTWTSGLNAGLAMEVKAYAGSVFTLHLPMFHPMFVGDAYTVYPGCRKRFAEDCVTKFGNGLNFRGEPHVPGNDRTMQVGGL